MYAELNACMRKRLGACMRNLGAKYMETVGCMYAVVGCKVCGCWVQSIWRRLGAKYMPFGCISDTADSLPDSR